MMTHRPDSAPIVIDTTTYVARLLEDAPEPTADQIAALTSLFADVLPSPPVPVEIPTSTPRRPRRPRAAAA